MLTRKKSMGMDVEFILNGRPIRLEVDPELTLLDLLRNKLGLTGTKCGCDSGDCGVCSVLLDGKLIKSCLVSASSLGGRRVITIEGMMDTNGSLGDLQQSFLRHGAVQCGYCTPAMILAGEALLNANPNPNRDEIRDGISRVLCRCTGYQQIIDAIEETAQQRQRDSQNHAQNILEGAR
jgi:aerobic-type carbon monoxide dehydrogenase small subunit (CoxS/CutS family)